MFKVTELISVRVEIETLICLPSKPRLLPRVFSDFVKFIQ